MQNGVDKITAVTLANYHAQVLTETASGVISDTGARDAMQVARQFIRRLWSLSVISLPNNIDSHDLEIHVQTKPIEPWDFEVLGGILRDAPEPLRLYLLLMANCGMTQKDVSDLLPSQVDWEKGIITRKRSKTKKWDNVPTVSYQLWGDTFELLKKHGKRKGERVFLTTDGVPLVVDKMSSKFKGSKRDKINQLWMDWSTRQRIKNNKGLKAIRKTSATKLSENSKYSRFTQYFLAQSPKTVADKHYIRPSQTEFDKAVTWLGKQYRE
jgi:integrase